MAFVQRKNKKDDLDILETLYINILKTLNPDGYNLKEGGSSNKHSKETRQKISKSLIGKNKGKKHTEESRKNMSEAHKGKTSNRKGKYHSEESKQKISEINKSLWEDKEYILKQSIVRKNRTKYAKGWKQTEEAKEKNRQAHLNKIPVNKKEITNEMIDDYRNGIKRKDFCFKHKVSVKIWYRIIKELNNII
jgi:group I intron endonuclease